MPGVREAVMNTWGVWDYANRVWVGGNGRSESEARYLATHWNATYRTIYYVARDGARD